MRLISHSACFSRQSPGSSVHITVSIPNSLAVLTTHGLRSPKGGRKYFAALPTVSSKAFWHCRSSLRMALGRYQKRFGCVCVVAKDVATRKYFLRNIGALPYELAD